MKNTLNGKNELIGKMVVKDGKIAFDETVELIENLIKGHLIFIKISKDGWNELYLNPDDLNFWEKYMNESELHGGGTPCLRLIKKEDANKLY